MGAAGPLLDRLDALPRTVAHHDTHGNNLFSETTKDGRRTVAIDWSDLGTAPVGQDLGHHIALNLFLRVVPPSDAAEHERTATEAYLEGLRAFGWHGDEDDVRFAALTTAAVQMLSFAACHIAWLCPTSARSTDGRKNRPRSSSATSTRSWIPGARWSDSF